MINIIGTIFGTSGYDIHTRELANALNELTEVSLQTNLIPNWERNVNDKELEMIKRGLGDINLIITNPLHWKINCNAKRNWVFLVWEGDKIPKCYLEECLNPDIEYIFVPSNHTRDAIINTSQEESVYDCNDLFDKIKIMPHGVDLNKFYSLKELPVDGVTVAQEAHDLQDGKFNSSSTDFIFLANKGWRNLEDRGGTQYLIQAYIEEFKPEDNIQLIVKINPAYGVPNIDNLMKELGHNNKSPQIIFDTNAYDYDKLVNLYHKCDVFVCPTRAEAFNIPGAEAKACGKMTIQTGFGGQIDYMKEGTDLFIDYELMEVKHELQYEGCSWAKVKIEDLRKKLRWCYENQEEVKERGKQASEEIKDWTWNATAEQIKKLL